MRTYVVVVYRSPGRVFAHSRLFRAADDWQARQKAPAIAEQWAHRARIARYRVTWELHSGVLGPSAALPVHTGRLVSAASRREAQG